MNLNEVSEREPSNSEFKDFEGLPCDLKELLDQVDQILVLEDHGVALNTSTGSSWEAQGWTR